MKLHPPALHRCAQDHLPIGAVLKLKHFYVEAFGDAHPPQPPAPGDPPQAIQDFEGL